MKVKTLFDMSVNIQKKVLNDALKDSNNKKFLIKKDENNCYISDGKFAMKILTYNYFLTDEAFRSTTVDIKKFIVDLNIGDKAQIKCYVKDPKDGKNIAVLRTSNGDEAHIDTALLSYFPDNVGFEFIKKYAPVKVMYGSDVIGVVLPIRCEC